MYRWIGGFWLVILGLGIVSAQETAQLIFMSDRDGDYDIYTLGGEEGGRLQQLTDNSILDGGPVWSPDGQLIAFHSDQDGDSEIYVITAEGGEARQLTDNDRDDENPLWSPDGTQIAFIAGPLYELGCLPNECRWE